MKRTISLVLVLALGLTMEVANADFIFGTPTNLGPTVNSPYDEWDPSISTDGLELFFSSWQPGGYGESDLWMSKPESISDDWGEAVNLGPIVNSAYREGGPSISSDGLELYFDSSRPGGSGSLDLWMARRATASEDWGEPVNLGPVVNSSAQDQNPCISTDGLELFFGSRRVGSDNFVL